MLTVNMNDCFCFNKKEKEKKVLRMWEKEQGEKNRRTFLENKRIEWREPVKKRVVKTNRSKYKISESIRLFRPNINKPLR